MSRKPNILFFFTDDQRFDTIHALNCPEIQTPNLDRLVESGTTFTNGYIMGGTSGAVCMPSRAMLMTGRTLFHIQEQGQDIAQEHTMLGEHLRASGYHTHGIGKWHNGPASYVRSFTSGNRIFFGGMSDHWAVPLSPFDPEGTYPNDRIFHEDKVHSSDLFSGAAVEFIENYREDRPFFAYVAFTAPHDPRDTHPKFHELYRMNLPSVPENLLPEHPFDNGALQIRDEKLAPWPRTPGVIRTHLADYYAMISHADSCIGRVIDALKASGQYENTIVVFAGDNGLALGRHGLMGKQNLYDHSVHVPLVFSGPGIPKGERRDAYAYLLDIFPTLCDLTGLHTPDSVEGMSLVPVLQDAGASVRDVMHFAYTHYQRAVQDDRWKLIEYHVEGKRTTQLFDRQVDPLEMKNLADDPSCAGHLACLRKELKTWKDDLGDPAEGFYEAPFD